MLHADAGKSDGGTLSWLRSPASKVSYHVLVGRSGIVYDVVDPARRAWACGVSSWRGVPNVNDYSLSLAFANRHDGTEPLTPAQVRAAQFVVAEWRAAYPIEAVTTHAAIAPGRKDDPDRIPNFALEDYP